MPAPPSANNVLSNTWVYAGIASSFPNIEPPSPDLPAKDRKARVCRPPKDPWDERTPEDDLPQPCKIFQTSTTGDEVSLNELSPDEAFANGILIFKYRDKFHAFDNACPHQAYPLARGTISDIEDFGIVLSAGLTCPKHGWTFDLHTGEADTSRYKLSLYEVDLRAGQNGEDEVWIKKKERKRIG